MKKRKMQFVGLVAVVALAAVSMWAMGAEEAGEPAVNLPAGHLSAGGRFTDFVQEAIVDAVVPVWYREWGSDAGLVFFNPRGTFEESAEQEMNLGLGYRHLWGDSGVIAGLNAYYDARWTRRDNRFDQLGLGAELLTEWVDARFNYYIPEDDRQIIDEFDEVTVSQSTSSSVEPPIVLGRLVLSRTRRTTTTTTTTRHFVQYEIAREGYDAEVGVKLPHLPDWFETRVFAGYYDFDSPFSTADAEGIRGRLEIRTLPALFIDAEVFEDKDLNGSDFIVGCRIQTPFDLAQLFHGGNPFGGARGAWEPVERQFRDRLTERVMRDTHVRLEESETVLEKKTTSSKGGTKTGLLFLVLPPPPPPPPPPPEEECDECQSDPS